MSIWAKMKGQDFVFALRAALSGVARVAAAEFEYLGQDEGAGRALR